MSEPIRNQPRRGKPRVCKLQPSETLRGHQMRAAALDWYGDLILQSEPIARWRWPALEPPPKEPLPEFPLAALPEFVRRWALEVARTTQTPVDLAAMVALSAGSAAAGNRCRIATGDGWSEPLSLFAAVMMEPGSRQATVFKEALLPLREWEAQCRAAVTQQSSGDMPSPGGGRMPPLRERTEPAPISRFLTESTDKMLLASLSEHGACASLSASGGILRQLVGRNYLSLREQVRLFETAHEGDSIVFQRTPTRFHEIEEPALACGLAIDPSLAAGMASSPRFAGQSLLSRFLFATPASSLGRREIGPPAVSKGARGAYRAALRNVLTAPRETRLVLSPAAEKLLRDWEAELEPQLADDGPEAAQEGMREWLARLPSATRRIAAILHLMVGGIEAAVSDMAMSAAIAIARYLVPHAQGALARLGMLPTPPEADFDYLLRWITGRGYRTFSAAAAWQSVRRRFRERDNLDRALADMVRRGYLRQVEVAAESRSPGRPSAGRYEVNPAVYGEAPPEEPKRSIFDFEPEEDAREGAKRKAEAERKRSEAFQARILSAYQSHVAIGRSIRRKREKLMKTIAKKNAPAVHAIQQTQGKPGAEALVPGFPLGPQ